MEVIDIIIIVLGVIGLIDGFKDGFIKELAGLVGLVGGILLARKLYLSVAVSLTPMLGTSEKTTQIIAFILIMLVVPMACSVIAWLISKLLKSVGLGFVNRLLGGVLGVAKMAIFAGLLITGIEAFDFGGKIISPERKEASALYYPLYHTTGVLIKDVKEQIDRWQETNGDDADADGETSAEADEDALQPFEKVI